MNRTLLHLVRVVCFGSLLAATARVNLAQQGYETHLPFPAPVLNAPYTAERITTSYQELADGTQITHEKRVLMARDSVGRT